MCSGAFLALPTPPLKSLGREALSAPTGHMRPALMAAFGIGV